MPDQPTILDGKAVADRILEQTRSLVDRIVAESGITPGLATVIVGGDPASHTYVRMKQKRCESVGMQSWKVALPEDATTDDLVAEIEKLGSDPKVHGILLQHPSPPQIDERAGFEAIPASKDVDGVTIASFGAMAFGHPGFASCTPGGIIRLLDAYDVNVEGMEAVVVGRSPILGKPMAMLLLGRNATVTVCHSRTKNLAQVVKRADLVVAAVGKAEFVQGDWIKDGAIVVDAGYNEGNVGDVDYDAAAKRASMITPVPGSVGPMTIAMLIAQTAEAAATQLGVGQ